MDYGNTSPIQETEVDQILGQVLSNAAASNVTVFPEAPRTFTFIQEPHMSDFNPEDANAVSRFFQSIAEKVVLASTLPKEVEDLRKAVEELKRDVEQYREHMQRADEEISNLRKERQQLQDENAALQHELANEKATHAVTLGQFNDVSVEREHWRSSYGTLSQTHEGVRKERDDAQMKTLELEDRIKALETERDSWRSIADSANARLAAVNAALSGIAQAVNPAVVGEHSSIAA